MMAESPADSHIRLPWETPVTYQAPLADMGFALKYGTTLLPALEEGLFGDLTMDDVDAVLSEAGRMAGEVIAPLNRVGDQSGTTFKDGASPPRPAGKRLITPGAKPAGTGSPHRPNGADRDCRKSSSPRAQRCGTRPRCRLASGRY